MRILLITALGVSIAACSGGADADSDDAFTPGTYTLVIDDRPGGRDEKVMLTIKEDKTYEVSEVEASGGYTVSDADDGKEICFTDADRPDRDEMCLTAGKREEDGSWTVTREGDDEEATLTRVEN